MRGIITDETEIYVYFELIKRMQPGSVLDIGMFLTRIGALSRQAMNCGIPKEVELTGVKLFDGMDFPVHRKVYDRMLTLSSLEDKTYDLAALFSVNEYLDEKQKPVFWEYLGGHCKCILADTRDALFVQYVVERFRCEAIMVDNRQYAVVYCG